MAHVNCKNCNKTFEAKLSRLKNGQICCSMKCRVEFQKENQDLNSTCFSCGRKFHTKKSHLDKMQNPELICCSYECSKDQKKILMSGAKNHQYGLKGDLNKTHKSDIKLSSYGYLMVREVNHPLADKNGFVLFHRLVMEDFLIQSKNYIFLILINERYVLNPCFIVHHIDENKLNNSIDNLEIMTLEEHSSLHSEEKIREIVRDEITGRLMPSGKIKSGKLFRANNLDAGQDVFSSENVIIPPGCSKLISTGLVIDVPINHAGLLWSRSGLSVKYQIEVGAGCIDSGYSGEVKVHLYNHGLDPYKVNSGDRIAQLLTIPINPFDYLHVQHIDESNRGSSGFGSTGVL